MKFIFLFLGKTREKYLDEAINDYINILNRYVPANIVVIKEKHSRKSPDKTLIKNDAAALLDQLHKE